MATANHKRYRHPEEPRACTASPRTAACARGASFETPRKGAAPQDEDRVRGLVVHHHIGMLHLRRAGEMRADQRAPLTEILRTAKIHGVIFQRLPFDVQAVARR